MKKLVLIGTMALLGACQIQDPTGDGANSDDVWIIDANSDWEKNAASFSNLQFEDGMAVPEGKTAVYQSILKAFKSKKSIENLVVGQSPVWENWRPVENIGPSNLGDAPIALRVGPNDYWMFGRYQFPKNRKKEDFQGEEARLPDFDIPLKTSPIEGQYDAPGGLQPMLGGYHAWQSRDMKTWVHHGAVSEYFSRWMTTAEYADGKFYLYYDFPNDQDPHLYIDSDLTDGVPILDKITLSFKK